MRHDVVGPFLISIALLFGALPAGAQPRVIGVMAIDPPEAQPAWDKSFGAGLRKLGYKLGQSLHIEYRFASGDISQYPKLARELLDRRPALIVTLCRDSLRAVREISRTLPVISMCADEVNFLGEVATLARPGGHTTGILLLSPESVGKRLQLLKEIHPRLSRVAVLHDAHDSIPAILQELERLRPTFGLALQRLPVGRVEDLEAAFEAMARERAQALYIIPDNRMVANKEKLAQLARKHWLSAVFDFSSGAEAGLLLSYGASVQEFIGKTVPMYVDKILKGTKPGDLPVVLPSLFELTVNLKTAREIGVQIPQSILLRADRVIE